MVATTRIEERFRSRTAFIMAYVFLGLEDLREMGLVESMVRVKKDSLMRIIEQGIESGFDPPTPDEIHEIMQVIQNPDNYAGLREEQL